MNDSMNKKLLLLSTIIMSLVCFAPVAVRAQGSITYLSNMTNSVGGNVSFGSDQWLAQSFETGTNLGGYTLDAFVLGGAGAPGSSISIYDNNAGVPENSLSGVGITLSPSTTYWIVATATFSQGTDYGYWDFTSDTNYYSGGGWIIDTQNSTFALSGNGADWTSYATHPPFELTVEATPLPEPSIWALLVSGIGLFFFCRRVSPAKADKISHDGDRRF
jgi:hypothetical protein